MNNYYGLIGKFLQKEHVALKINTPLVGVMDAFQNGMQRAISLALLPAHAGMYARFDQNAVDQAALDIFKCLPLPDKRTDTEMYLFNGKYAQYCEHGFQDLIHDNGRAAIDHAAKFVGLLEKTHTQINEGVNALLASIPLSAWTAFEVLMEDLWVASVNFSSSLAMKAGAGKQIAISSLGKYSGARDLNLSNLMGTILVNEDKVKVDSLQEAKKSFESTFDVTFRVFEDQHLKLLELLRNLIIHKSGKVDQQFVEDIKKANLTAHSDCGGVKLTQQFPLTGEMAFRFLETVEERGRELLMQVNGLLA